MQIWRWTARKITGIFQFYFSLFTMVGSANTVACLIRSCSRWYERSKIPTNDILRILAVLCMIDLGVALITGVCLNRSVCGEAAGADYYSRSLPVPAHAPDPRPVHNHITNPINNPINNPIKHPINNPVNNPTPKLFIATVTPMHLLFWLLTEDFIAQASQRDI